MNKRTTAPLTGRLGKMAPARDPRTLALWRYILDVPDPPKKVTWSAKCDANWPMYKNDEIGDCTCASAGHIIQAWTANGQAKEVELAEKDIVTFYRKVSGYNPRDPSSDTGAVELDVLNLWRKRGIAGHKIGAFAEIHRLSEVGVMKAIATFGGIYTGFALPISAQDQKVWDLPASGRRGKGAHGSWGGHAVPVLDYDSKGLTCVTWGGLKRMTWAFWRTYCDEAYGIISKDFLTGDRAPNGLDVDQLAADLRALKKR